MTPTATWPAAGPPPTGEAEDASVAAASAPPRDMPSALVLAAFPPAAGSDGSLGAGAVASLALLGARVHAVGVAGIGGEACQRLDFSKAVGVRSFERELPRHGFEIAVIDPLVLRFRRPRRLAHLGVAAVQLAMLWRLTRAARRVVLIDRRPRGFGPACLAARLILGHRGGARIDPAASLAQRHVTLARALATAGPVVPRQPGDPDRPWPSPGDASAVGARESAGIDTPAGAAGRTPIPAQALALDLCALAPGDRPARAAALLAAASRRAGALRLPQGVPSLVGANSAGSGRAARADALSVADASDPRWSVGGVRVTRLMVHMRAALGALPRLRPGSPRAARRLVAWFEGPMRARVGRALPMPLAAPRDAVPAQADAATSGRIEAWWSDLAQSGGFGAAIAAAPVPDDAEVDRLAAALRVIARRIEAGADLPPLDSETERLLGAPFAPGGGGLSGLEFALGAMSGSIDASPGCGAGWNAAPARAMVAALVPGVPGLGRFATRPEAGRAAHLTLIGFARTETGLGENLAMHRAALAHLGVPTRTLGLELGLAPVDTPPDAARPPAMRLSRPVRLLHVNADLVPQVMLQPMMAAERGALDIGFLLWEFGVLPEAHRLALDMLDEVWCPTDFVADAYRAAGRLPVHRIGKAVTLGPVEAAGRAELGLPDGPFLFMVSFDFHSSVERKNPLAAVRAFCHAFPPARRDVALVVKTTEVAHGHWGDPNGQWREILELARLDSRIIIRTGRMPRARYLAMIRAADCLVSPHRAEGFGYGPAQAMVLGRPAIVTDWSGTRDFCTAETSFPVPARLVDVAPRETILPLEGAVWAAIDEEALAATMHAVAEAPADARARGRAGQALMQREYSVEAHAGRCLARLRTLGVVREAEA